MAHVPRRLLSPGVALAAFFTLAFAYSWSFWIAAAMSAARGGGADSRLIYAGIPGPGVAAVVLLLVAAAPEERRDFWRRLYEVERIGPRWLWTAVLIYPVATVLAAAADRISGGTWPDTTRATSMLEDPVLLLAIGTSTFLLGPLPEEPGWRGYALDRLLTLGGVLAASVCLGLLWALWHLPLFFVPGTHQYDLGFGGLRFWLFNVTAVVGSILMTWVYLRNDRSTLAAILFHAAVNFTGATVMVSGRADLVRAGLLTLVAVVALRDLRSRPSARPRGTSAPAAPRHVC